MSGTLFYDQLFSVPKEVVRNRSNAGGSVNGNFRIGCDPHTDYVFMSAAQARRPFFELVDNKYVVSRPRVEKNPVDEDVVE